MRLTPPLNLPAPGRRQTLYVVFDFAESCVFSKQSPGPFHCDPQTLQERTLTHPTAHLLPKLRGQFAEFLHKGSLKRLGILSPSTCVGLRYGQPRTLPRGFSWQHGITHFMARRPRHHVSALMEERICLPLPPTRLNLHIQSQAGLSFCVTPSVITIHVPVQEY